MPQKGFGIEPPRRFSYIGVHITHTTAVYHFSFLASVEPEDDVTTSISETRIVQPDKEVGVMETKSITWRRLSKIPFLYNSRLL